MGFQSNSETIAQLFIIISKLKTIQPVKKNSEAEKVSLPLPFLLHDLSVIVMSQPYERMAKIIGRKVYY